MKRIILIVFALAVVVLTARGVLRSIELAQKKVPTIPELQEEQGIPVEVTPVVRRTVSQGRLYTGTIRGIEQADATAKTLERLIEVKVRVGDAVKRGDIVAVQDPDNPNARLQQAELTLTLAQRELQRRKALFADGAISQQELDFADHDVKIAESTIASIRELLNIRAPIDGVVTRIFKETGETADAAQEVLEVARLDPVELEIQVSESDINAVSRGQKAVVRRRQDAARSFEGTVGRIELSGSAERREFNVRIRIPNRDGALRPGMFAAADLFTQAAREALMVPTDAVLGKQPDTYVFIVAGNDARAERRAVQTGAEAGEFIEITGGVQEGEQIVLLGHNKLRDGAKVLVVKD